MCGLRTAEAMVDMGQAVLKEAVQSAVNKASSTNTYDYYHR